MSEFVNKQIETLVQGAEPFLSDRTKDEILGPELASLAAPLMSKKEVPVTAVLRLALFNDCLRVAEEVVAADEKISDAEVTYLYPLLRRIAPLLGRLRASYSDFEPLAPAQARDLLELHRSDGQPFGGKCKRSEWSGFTACRHLSKLSGADPLRKYATLMGRLIDEVAAHGGDTDIEEAVAARLRELVRQQTSLDDVVDAPVETETLAAAFCAPTSREVFHGVSHAEEIWERDPFDIDSVHSEARQRFDHALDAVQDSESSYGRSFVVLGESGAGKTHLLRAFRSVAHGSWQAFTGYVQLHAETSDYTKLILRRLVDSMDRPYDPPRATDSGLAVLSDALARRVGSANDARLQRLRDSDLSPEELSDLTNELADAGYQRGLSELHADLMRAFLLLQRRDPALRQRVLKLLRCEHLSPYEQRLLGDIAPWTDDTAASRMLVQLGKLAWEASGAALLLLVDQLEDLSQQGETDKRFRRVADTIRWITDQLPHSLVVLASLEDFFVAYSKDLTRAVRDRLERDPPPIRLTSDRRFEEVQDIVAKRLSVLYGEVGLEASEQPLYPFTADILQRVRNLRTRDVIDWCASYHRRCRDAGELVPYDDGGAIAEQRQASGFSDELQKALDGDITVPSDDDALMDLVRWGFERFAEELGAGASAKPLNSDGAFLSLALGSGHDRLYAGLSNKMPQGGHLARQLEGMADTAKKNDARLVLLRQGEFPSRPRTQIAEVLGKLVKDGAQKVIVADEELRKLAALKTLWSRHDAQALNAWAKESRPLRSMKLYSEMLGSTISASARQDSRPPPPSEKPSPPPQAATAQREHVEPTPPPQAGKPHAPEPARSAVPEPATAGLRLGHGLGLKGGAVTIDKSTLTKHAAIVGATGSGKTTLALSILEQILLQGTPVLMVDRKGDLCTYADPAFWEANETDDERRQQKARLKERVDVRVYTPGDSRGRPLSIQLAPAGLADLSPAVRGPAATHAAAALASMLSIKVQPHEQKLGILAKSIELLAEMGEPITIDRVTRMIQDRDPDLMNLVGGLKQSHFDTLAERLLTLRMLNEQLFESGGEQLAGDLLFGRNDHNGKTRLSIVSTKGLRGDEVAEFWVAQLLSELLTWSSRNPSPKLQAVVFLDEADLYLPATSKPATKEPMLDLLKRGRSAGLSVLLGTQNPGDFDYKARGNLNAWFLGRVSQVNDLRRMKPLLSEARPDVSGKLANAGRGEFYLLEAGHVMPFQASRSIMETRQLGEDDILALARR